MSREENKAWEIANYSNTLYFCLYLKKFANKNAREYDIVNLHGSESARKRDKEKLENSPKVKAPLRNAYNPINNQPLP